MTLLAKKSQSGIEFLIITSLVIFLFTIFFIAIEATTLKKGREKEEILVKNLALSIQDEINIASETSDGYIRKFYVPLQILGKEYEVKIIDKLVYIKTDSIGLSLETKEISGQLKKGENIIKKENGEVYINQ